MTPVALALTLLTVAGVAAVRWALRIAPPLTEVPAKAMIGTLLSGLVVAAELGWASGSPGLRLAALVLGPLFVLGPLVLLAIVRAGRPAVAGAAAGVLYWTPRGRRDMGRWLAVAALADGDAEAALELAGEGDELIVAQAQGLLGRWDESIAAIRSVLGRELPDATRAFAKELLVRAHIGLGDLRSAEVEAAAMRSAFDPKRDSPLTYRSVTLARARVAAERGDVQTVRELLAQPLPGAGPSLLLGVVGRAATVAGERDMAVEALTRAHESSKGALRSRFAAELAALGVVPRARPRAVPVATYSLVGAIAAAFLSQSLLDQAVGPVRAVGAYLRASDYVAAYVQGLPGVPGTGSWWRFLSYAFVHANLVHAAFNAWVLLDLGRAVEQRRGWADVAGSFALGVAGGSLLTSVVQAGAPLVLVGASGGVFGVAGALAVGALMQRSAADLALLRSLGTFLALNMLFSLLPGVSLWGHVGGLAAGAGFALARSWLPGRSVGALLGAIGLGALLAALGTALATVLPTL